ncbi:MAG: hypothetical protein ABW047_03695 [Nitrospiraceae bacterium]
MHSTRTKSAARLLIIVPVIIVAVLLNEGCSTHSSRATDSPTHPTVYFDEVADWSFEASHPATISSGTIAQILQGIYVREPRSATSSADGSKPMKAFSDEDVKSLAPLLAQKLSQAKPEYVVAFRLSSSAGSGSEPTAGTLYVQNEQLYLTLISYQGSLTRGESSMFNQDRPARTITFEPQSAGHIEKAPPSVALGQHDLTMVAIDYTRMDQSTDGAPKVVQAMKQPEPVMIARNAGDPPMAPETQETQEIQEAPDQEMVTKKEQELKDAQQSLTRKDAKINSLRRDLESMRQQLEAKDKELRSVKAKQASAKREKRRTAEVVIR